MSGGNYTTPTRAAGTLITALIYNSDMQTQVDGRSATEFGGYSTTPAQMQTIVDPYPSSQVSLSPDLAGELARLRFCIADMKTVLNGGVSAAWYDALTATAPATIGARIRRTTVQAISDNTVTAINFNGSPVVDFNTGVWSAGAPTRFTAPSDGFYYICANVSWAQALQTVGARQLQLRINGSAVAPPMAAEESNLLVTTPIPNRRQAIATTLKLTAGDYAEFFVLQHSGFSANLNVEADNSIVGAMVFLGAV